MKAELIPATDTSTPSINLTMISYPGLHIATKTEIKTSFLEGLFNSSRHDDQIEDVSIPIAETYGTPSLEAIEALEKWCSAQDTAKFCVDDNARHIFASAVSPAILSKENGKYTTQLKVVLVNRVYMTRQLNVTRTWNVTTDIAQGAVPKGSTKQPDEQHGTQAEIDIASTSASYSDGLETRIETKEKFPRPLVFGFKSISFILPPKPKPK
ncbi:hypothetical protein X762_30310 [Mesorhizobium sp. LSHC426A00]|nr:hypothetical protein X762_30310 [Mesorhizobium sp. LSHC426A00]ESX45421.1 hypothetical protein X761_32165 [Mesorhizobium sp. LSHC424B00]ESX64361.1 hypothetical protein X758_31805 [Mesorhizobium sp. LSHC416B00]